MIPLKQTPEEQRAGWSDYCRRRNRARAGILSLPVFFFLAAQIPRFLPSLSFTRVIAAVSILLLIVLLLVVYPTLKRWLAWKCPKCGNQFASTVILDKTSPGLPAPVVIIILWRLAFSERCGYCRKPALDRDIKTDSVSHALPSGKLIRWDSDTENDGRNHLN